MSGYYLIVSQMHGLALDVDGGSGAPGARVIPWQKHGNDNQQWYDDPSTGTIRTKINNFCLDIEQQGLCIKPYQPGDPNQQWERSGHHIRNRFNQNEVLDIVGANREPKAPIGKYGFNGGPNQSWHFEFVGGQPPSGGMGGYPNIGASTAYPGGAGGYPPQQGGYPPQQGGYPPQQGGYPPQQGGYPPQQGGYPPQQGGYPPQQGGYPEYPPQQGFGGAAPRRDFYIVSELNQKVIDIRGANQNPGEHIIMYGKNNQKPKNQLWYTDPQGFIRSALNDLPFQAQGGHNCKTTPYTGDPHQQWMFEGNKVVNRSGECLDIVGASHHDGAEICAYQYKKQANQHWKAEHVN